MPRSLRNLRIDDSFAAASLIQLSMLSANLSGGTSLFLFFSYASNATARGGKWEQVDARTLVPGDIVRLYLGDVVPADCKLIQGDYISIDQSALTGESLPVTKKSGEDAYSGSVVKQGEMVAVITATGGNTFFGRTAKLVAGAGNISHFQRAVMKIGNFLIILALVLVVILVASRLFDMRGHYDRAVLLRLAEIVLILLVASGPWRCRQSFR
jgi:H+-transporting ATPase